MKLLENNFHRFITTLYAVQKYLTLRLTTHIKSIYKEDNQHVLCLNNPSSFTFCQEDPIISETLTKFSQNYAFRDLEAVTFKKPDPVKNVNYTDPHFIDTKLAFFTSEIKMARDLMMMPENERKMAEEIRKRNKMDQNFAVTPKRISKCEINLLEWSRFCVVCDVMTGLELFTGFINDLENHKISAKHSQIWRQTCFCCHYQFFKGNWISYFWI